MHVYGYLYYFFKMSDKGMNVCVSDGSYCIDMNGLLISQSKTTSHSPYEKRPCIPWYLFYPGIPWYTMVQIPWYTMVQILWYKFHGIPWYKYYGINTIVYHGICTMLF